MKKISLLTIFLLSPILASADIFDYHAAIKRDQSICEYGLGTSQLVEQQRDANRFFAMMSTLEKDSNNERESKITVMDEGAFGTTLKNKSTGKECSIVLHGGCFSASCE